MPTLLLADDSVTIQRVIELTFADEDIAVVAVGSGEAALMRLSGPPPDIVLADVDMPGPDGYAIARHVRDTPTLARVPVLLLTGAFDPVDEGRLQECGASGVLVKPFEPQMVITRVRDLLRRGASPVAAAPARAAGSASPVTPPAGTVQPAPARTPPASEDDYFDRLDAAFASLNVPLEPATLAAAGREPTPAPHAPAPVEPSTGLSRPPVATSASAPAAAPLSMADAFGALLGMEHGEPPPPLPEPSTPGVTDDVVEQIARRVTEEVSERIVQAVAPDIVARVAERVVRDEIERLKRRIEDEAGN